MWHRYWTQGHAERHHGGVLVRVQGRAVCVHRAGEEEAGAQVDWRSSKLGHVSKSLRAGPRCITTQRQKCTKVPYECWRVGGADDLLYSNPR